LVALELKHATGEVPTDEDILIEVMEWKQNKRPPLNQDEVLMAVHSLAMLGWLEVRIAQGVPVDESALVGL
jgi:hypothetical protein